MNLVIVFCSGIRDLRLELEGIDADQDLPCAASEEGAPARVGRPSDFAR